MPVNKCRVCGNKFFEKPLLRYRNMPRAAQFLPDAEQLKKDRGIDLVVCQCSSCGLTQLSNNYVPYYREVIRSVAFSDEMKKFRRKQFGSFVQKYSLKGKKIIEIGCGGGEYLSIMQQLGIECYGLEYSKELVKQSVKNDLRVSKGFIQNSSRKLRHGPFDAFFMLNFIEHLPNPNSVLRGIYDNLTDGAVGLVEVPNFDMILKKNLFSEFIHDHLLYFTRETLNTALRLNGFEMIGCRKIWHEYTISAIVKKKRMPDITNFYKHQIKLKNEIESYIRHFKYRKVAIWGAGHQALTIISLMNLADRIRYVVDSAVFKQGRYTPATHIPIVSPDALAKDPVEAVIIMGASYSDEIGRIIRQRFDKKISISILRDFGLENID